MIRKRRAETTPRRARHTGLAHPESLSDWQQWQDSQRRLQIAKAAVTGRIRNRGRAPEAPAAPALTLTERAGTTSGRLLIPIDTLSATSLNACLSVLPYVSMSVAVLHPAALDLTSVLGAGFVQRALDCPSDPDVVAAQLVNDAPTAVLTTSTHLDAGAVADEVSRRAGISQYVVQHGALTPFAPPLPREAHLLAWTDADADFWTSSRRDITATTVGSQHLWEAAQNPLEDDIDERPMFLGQLHGAELPRTVSGGAAVRFCRSTGALYRPHPREEDALSRAQHWTMKKAGIEFADTSVPLSQVPNQVVAVFSTGVLEASVRGIPGWVYAERPPMWVVEFWRRYGMATWGSSEPTAPPALIDAEPATLIAPALGGAA
ncbi:hypothetical protein [Helcobacillus massiliensis]|uniref:RNA-binding protein n=1 Tax=Helcobacillus massiliensis TaxID=521392 RepID=A0A839QV32_9MICO|nr:hypothetical protein [Helcobacillus massiliensis]MBB3023498.1 hypothetical protein [Helcobacillus massiliensis]